MSIHVTLRQGVDPLQYPQILVTPTGSLDSRLRFREAYCEVRGNTFCLVHNGGTTWLSVDFPSPLNPPISINIDPFNLPHIDTAKRRAELEVAKKHSSDTEKKKKREDDAGAAIEGELPVKKPRIAAANPTPSTDDHGKSYDEKVYKPLRTPEEEATHAERLRRRREFDKARRARRAAAAADSLPGHSS